MGKEKGARVAEKNKSSGKAPLLQPRYSARGDAAASQKTDVVTDDGGSKECEDFHYDTQEMYQFLETIEGLKGHSQCVDCRREAAAGKPTLLNPRFVMCSGCSQCFCAGLASNEDGPIGHARLHAKSACHPVALWIDQPDAAYCFQCAHSLSLKAIALAARSHKHGYAVRGMPNCRAKCYVNALVQCLLALDDLWMSMLGPRAPAGPLGVALKELFLETRSGNDAGAILNTRKLMESICPLDARYRTTDHQDCQELLVHVRNGLIDEERRRRRLPDVNVRKDAPTVVDSIFKGEVSVTWTCKRCLHAAGKDEEFYELSLPLPPSKEHPSKSVPAIKQCRRILEEEKKKAAASLPSIKQCIGYYFRKVKVQKRCEICEKPSTGRSKDGGQMVANINSGGPADETLCLTKLPPVLTIHVLRFKIDEKRVGHVKFEEDLDVGEYLDPRSADKDNARYRLVGVIEHLGRTVTPGHFVAYVRGSSIVSEQEPSSSSSSWFQANDTRIRNLSLDDVLKREAFLLFYEKIKA